MKRSKNQSSQRVGSENRSMANGSVPRTGSQHRVGSESRKSPGLQMQPSNVSIAQASAMPSELDDLQENKRKLQGEIDNMQK